ncbi:hypothetical protein ABT213_18520 [Streptomyces sp. NPDC001674]|uniref:hypothetical protein n=1 Tax=Streptomyces sp. NPDC001674 TaxID=3154394 RepID=UPI00332A4B30
MFTIPFQRPLLLAAASLALVSGTACAAQAAVSHTPAATSASAPALKATDCTLGGAGGAGGEGGKGGQGGQPGQPGEPGKPGGTACLGFDDLPDKPKSELTVVDKARIALTVIADDSKEMKDKIAAKYKITHAQIDTWKKQYLEGDWFALMNNSAS